MAAEGGTGSDDQQSIVALIRDLGESWRQADRWEIERIRLYFAGTALRRRPNVALADDER
jgi:hypothetical protein